LSKLNSNSKVAVCSRSFSRNKFLRDSLLQRYGDVKFNDDGLSLSHDALVDFLSDATHAIVALELIDEYVLSFLPKLKRISKYGVGLNNIDLSALNKSGVQLGWKGGVNARSVAELVICSSIYLRRNLEEARYAVVEKQWRQVTGRLLSGCAFGVVGCGHVGSEVLRLLKPFGCDLFYADINEIPEVERELNASRLPLEELMSTVDILSLHVPLDSSTQNLIGKHELALMKKGALLINTARGGVLDEQAFKEMLISGCIAGAFIDVFAEEPFYDEELLTCQNFMATPHIGGSSEEAILAMGLAAIESLSENDFVISQD